MEEAAETLARQTAPETGAEAAAPAAAAPSDSDRLTGPRQFPAIDPDTIRQAFESGRYPYARLMGRVAYEAEKARL